MRTQTFSSSLKRSAAHPAFGATLVFLLWLIPCQSPPLIPESLRVTRFAATFIAAGAAVLAMRWSRGSGVTFLDEGIRRHRHVLSAGSLIFVLIFVFCVVYYDKGPALIPVGLPGLDNCCDGQDRKDCIHDRLNLSPEAIAECWGPNRVTAVQVSLVASYWWTAWASGAWIGLLLLRWRKSTIDPDIDIPQDPSPWKYDLFLSYSRKDKDFVERLDNDLHRRGYGVWWDHRIGAGRSIFSKLDEGLEKSRQFAVLLSPDSCNSHWVRREIGAAMGVESERLMEGVGDQAPFLIPILIRECKIPTLLKDTEYVDFTQSYEEGFAELLRHLRPPSGTP